MQVSEQVTMFVFSKRKNITDYGSNCFILRVNSASAYDRISLTLNQSESLFNFQNVACYFIISFILGVARILQYICILSCEFPDKIDSILGLSRYNTQYPKNQKGEYLVYWKIHSTMYSLLRIENRKYLKYTNI